MELLNTIASFILFLFAGAFAYYSAVLVEEQKNRTLERKRSAITSDADDADRTRKLTAEEVEKEFRSRMSGEGSGGE